MIIMFDWFHLLKFQVINFFYWGWKLKSQQHWDSATVYYMLELKLKLLERDCYHNGNHVWSEKSREYKALKECQVLAKKLYKEESPNMDQIDFNSIPRIGDHRNPSPKELQAMVYLRLAHDADSELNKVRRERLFSLLAKWMPYWWN